MSGVFSKRIPCTNGVDVRCNVLEVRVFYDLGGISWATYEPKPRGYYLSVSPLCVSGNMVSYQGFSGTRMLLNEVKRQSKKGEEEALRLMKEKEQMLIEHVCKEHGIKIKESA